jgi:transcriptional regulator with XRE-family HTH domain
MQAFGQALREARLAKGYSQEGLALDSNVDRSYVSLLERGVRQPSLLMIHSLAGVLGLRPHELVRRAEEARPSDRHPGRRVSRRR